MKEFCPQETLNTIKVVDFYTCLNESTVHSLVEKLNVIINTFEAKLFHELFFLISKIVKEEKYSEEVLKPFIDLLQTKMLDQLYVEIK